jgi:ABC-2 type transport system ATP-binding protein
MSDPVKALEVSDLAKSYDTGRPALEGVSFGVASGSITGFIGLNGAGKTTTIRIIAGLLEPDRGSVRVLGHDVHPGGTAHLRETGFVLDEPMYFDWMAAREYLAFVGTLRGLPPAETERRSAELLDFFDLASKAHDPIGVLSTGMKKKISLASAMIHAPRLLVLDEPLEGIDALAASAIKETLQLMAGRGTAVLITSHVLETVERLCDAIVMIDGGRIVLQGTTRELQAAAAESLPAGSGGSLEALFLRRVGGRGDHPKLSWL